MLREYKLKLDGRNFLLYRNIDFFNIKIADAII